MTQPISPYGAPPAAMSSSVPSGPRAEEVHGFKELLLKSIVRVDSMQHEAGRAVDALAGSHSVSPAEVFSAVQKADVAYRMMMQVHHELVQVFQQIHDIRV